MIPRQTIRKHLVQWILFFLFAGNIMAQPYVHISDPAFLKFLKEQGLTTRDSLDLYKIWGKKTLDVSGSGIYDLQGIEYFTHLENLNCSHNKITTLKHLPASLKVLDCSNNNIIVLRNLPEHLEELYCSYNNIAAIRHIPPTLTTLICTNNNLKYLPALPPGIKRFNYARNPVDERRLPYSYRMSPCIYDNQNCVPNIEMDWDIMHNDFDYLDPKNINAIRITVIHQWGRGSIENSYDYRLKGKRYVLTRLVNKETEDNMPEYQYLHPKYEFDASSLYPVITAIGRDELNVKVNIRGRMVHLNFIDNLNRLPVRKSRSVLKRYLIWFQFYTNDGMFSCYYEFDDSIEDGLDLAPSSKPNDLREILNWLYCYKLVKVALPPDEEVVQTFFGFDQLEKILYIEGYNMFEY